MARKSGSRRADPSATEDPKNLCENCYSELQLRETMTVPPWFFNHSVRISPQIRQWQTIDLEASESKQERRVLEMAYSTVINHQAKLFNDPISEAGLSPEDLLNHIRLAIGSMGGRAKVSFTIERPDEPAVTASAVVSDDAQSLIHPGPEAAKALSTLLPKRNHPIPEIYQVPAQRSAAGPSGTTAPAEAAGRKDSVHSSHPPSHVAKPVTPPSSDGSKASSGVAVPAVAPPASFVPTFPTAPSPAPASLTLVSSFPAASATSSAVVPNLAASTSPTSAFVPPFPAAAPARQASDEPSSGLLLKKPASPFIPYIPSQPSLSSHPAPRKSLIVKLRLPTTSRPTSSSSLPSGPSIPSSTLPSAPKRKRSDSDSEVDDEGQAENQPKPRRRKTTRVDDRWDYVPIGSDEEGDHEEGVRRLMSSKHSEKRGGRMMRERKGTSYRED